MHDVARGQFGMVGLGVMGRNLALNVLDHGYRVVGCDVTPSLLDAAVTASAGRLRPAATLQQLVDRLERPRTIMMMVPAGPPVDRVLDELLPLLATDDIVIDGGNSLHTDTRRREQRCAHAGVHFFGVGVSGGAHGARHGPSIMPGGDRAAYDATIRPIFEAIAARTASGPCVTHCGPDGAGHFVKLVHNGIEYADMQLIAEVYDVLARAGGLDAPALAAVFEAWNRGVLESFLVEITARLLTVRDDRTGGWLVDSVLDHAGQKGTGRWTVIAALELGVPIPSIAAAVDARVLSSMKPERVAASRILAGPAPSAAGASDAAALVRGAHDALYAARIAVYAQGMHLIAAASDAYDWGIELREIARIWTGGCIIRARLLDGIMQAFARRPDLPSLLLDDALRDALASRQDAWRTTVAHAQAVGIPVPCLASALAYYDSVRTARLPQNLTQAQRDAFGAHTYQRTDDADGAFVHSDWLA